MQVGGPHGAGPLCRVGAQPSAGSGRWLAAGAARGGVGAQGLGSAGLLRRLPSTGLGLLCEPPATCTGAWVGLGWEAMKMFVPRREEAPGLGEGD